MKSLATFNTIMDTVESLHNAKKPLKEIRKIQWMRFKKILKHAYETVPFYHTLYKNQSLHPDEINEYRDIKKIPIVTKIMLQKAGDDMLSSKYLRNDLLSFQTSGSTGIPLKLFYSKRDVAKLRSFGARALFLNGMKLGDKRARIVHPSIFFNTSTMLQKLNLLRVYNISLFEPMKETISKLENIMPNILEGYSSTITQLANEYEKYNKKIKPHLILVYSELLETNMRDKIKKVFDIVPIDQYGAHETRTIGFECIKHQGYHINIDSLMLTLIDDNENEISAEEEGKVVVTNFFSSAMPIIRYNLEDIASYSDDPCTCGCELPLITELRGKMLNDLILPDGKILSPHLVKKTLGLEEGISQFKVTQLTKSNIEILIVPGKNFNDEISARLKNKLNLLFGNEVNVELILTDLISIPKSGKYKVIESKIS